LQCRDRQISIHIGDKSTTPFVVSETILKALSPVFTKMLENDSFAESQTGTIVFEEDGLELWHLFFHWMAERKLFESNLNVSEFLGCIVFTEKYAIHSFRNEAIRLLLQKSWVDFNKAEATQAIRDTVLRTSEKNPVREWLATQMVKFVGEGTLQTDQLNSLDGTGFMPLYISMADEVLAEVDYDKLAAWDQDLRLECYINGY
jgi:hypothetical protein